MPAQFRNNFDVINNSQSPESLANNFKFLGNVTELPSYVKSNAIDTIYIALPPSLHSETMLLLDHLKDTTASIYFVPNFFIADLIQARIDEIDGMPIVALCDTPFSGFNGFVKALSDLILSSLILCLISPILILPVVRKVVVVADVPVVVVEIGKSLSPRINTINPF